MGCKALEGLYSFFYFTISLLCSPNWLERCWNDVALAQLAAALHYVYLFHLLHLLGSHTVSVRDFCNSLHVSSVCLPVVRLSRVRSPKRSEIGTKFRQLYRKSGSPSKNMMSNFAPKVAKYPKSSPKLQNSPKWRSQ